MEEAREVVRPADIGGLVNCVIIHPCDGTHLTVGLIITKSNGSSGFCSSVSGRSGKSRSVGGEVRVVASCT